MLFLLLKIAYFNVFYFANVFYLRKTLAKNVRIIRMHKQFQQEAQICV